MVEVTKALIQQEQLVLHRILDLCTQVLWRFYEFQVSLSLGANAE